MAERTLLTLAGALLAGGLVLLIVVSGLWHPGGGENNHPVIFAKYARSDGWIAVHFGQFAALLLALAGFVVLYRALALRAEAPLLARLALASTIAAAAVWAVLQAVDGIALKHTVDAWMGASGAEKDLRFANAETVRWTEWGLNGYFRLLLGSAFVLFGVAIARTGIVYRWLGWVAVLGGLGYAAIGIAIGYTGFDKPGTLEVQLLFLICAVGVLVAGVRRTDIVEPGAA